MSKKKDDKKQPPITIDKNMRDYSNDPLVKEKLERANAFLKKHPIPKEFFPRKKKDS